MALPPAVLLAKTHLGSLVGTALGHPVGAPLVATTDGPVLVVGTVLVAVLGTLLAAWLPLRGGAGGARGAAGQSESARSDSDDDAPAPAVRDAYAGVLDRSGWWRDHGAILADVRVLSRVDDEPVEAVDVRALSPAASRLKGSLRRAPSGLDDDYHRSAYELAQACQSIALERGAYAGADLQTQLEAVNRTAEELHRAVAPDRASASD